MARADLARKMSVLPRMIEVICRIVLAAVVADPAICGSVHVRRNGMTRLIRNASIRRGLATLRCRCRFGDCVRRSRSVGGNVPAPHGLVDFSLRWRCGALCRSGTASLRDVAATLLRDQRNTKDHRYGKDSNLLLHTGSYSGNATDMIRNHFLAHRMPLLPWTQRICGQWPLAR